MPRDYREDTNQGLGWLVVSQWEKPFWEGHDGRQEQHVALLGEARNKAQQLYCLAGVISVSVVYADRPEIWVSKCDKRIDRNWCDDPMIRVFEQAQMREYMRDDAPGKPWPTR